MRNNKKRADAYFGLHFDFHAGDKAKGIGTYTTAENISKFLDEVKPDYIQIDTKGHFGYASFFSDYGDVAPGLECDHLKIIREETEKRGISLIAHHSSLWDSVACGNHPEWAVVDEEGNVSSEIIDLHSEYVDKKFIFQIKELCGKYGFDGVWTDGECWCLRENYKESFLKEFLKESGYDSVDTKNPDSPSHIAFRKYCRDELIKFMKYYMTGIKKDYPGFEISSSLAFSEHLPQKPIDEVDFLSADVYDLRHRVIARSFACHSVPWDIMAWGMPRGILAEHGSGGVPVCNAHTDRLYRVAAEAISLGGGFQIVNNMTPEGEVRTYEIENMKKVSAFMQERKQFNYKSAVVKDAAIWLSLADRERCFTSGNVCNFAPVDYGLCDTVLDNGRAADIIFDYHIAGDKISDYRTIIIPETKYISEENKNKLLKYLSDGGNLVICGAESCKLFSDILNAEVKDFERDVVYAEQIKNPCYASVTPKAVVFENYSGIELCNCYADKMDHSGEKVKSTALTCYGKGKAAFVGWDIIGEYTNSRRFVLREIMGDVLNAVDPEPFVYLKSGIKRVEIIPAQKDDMLLVNVINTNEYYYYNLDTAYGEIPPVYDIEIAVRCEKAPKSVMLEPEHIAPEYTYDGKYVYVKINKLEIHTVIAVYQ